ncbi:hypothetical protein FRB91_000778 [Serendipita sp. 411]|nr:hypothetical protein FRC19_011704 [Serendipita sp. 401]KAG8846481.1 hypothetical protein FRB91_000778 [Serendipita sp. 411]KAG9051808.1 hypothetical protein FS842_010996 [Serendipita sp. 407]
MSSHTKKVANKRTRSDEDKIRTLSEQLRQFDPNQIEQLTRLLGPKQKQPRLESREHTDGSGNEEEYVLRVPEDIADTPIPELRATAAELEITDRYSSEFKATHDEAKKAIENLVALKEGADLYKSSSKQQKQLRKTAEKVMLQICAANKTLHSIQLARRSAFAKSSKQAKNHSRRDVEDEDEDEDAIPSWDRPLSEAELRGLENWDVMSLPPVVRRAMDLERIPPMPIHWFHNDFAKSRFARDLAWNNGNPSSPHALEEEKMFSNLSCNDYGNACMRWIAALKESKGYPEKEAVGDSWSEMITAMLFSPSSSKSHDWEVVRVYLDAARDVCKPVGKWPVSRRLSRLWEMAEKKVKDELVNELKRIRDSLHSDSIFQYGASSKTTSKGGSRPSTGPSKPQEHNHFRGNRHEQRPPIQWCFVCGGKDHTSRTCQAGEQCDGREILLVRRKDQGKGIHWMLPSGKAFCYSWNLHAGCSNDRSGDGCKFGSHVCSRCLAADHSAVRCEPSGN